MKDLALAHYKYVLSQKGNVISYPRNVTSWKDFLKSKHLIPARGLYVIKNKADIIAYRSFTKFPNVHEVTELLGGVPEVRRAFRKHDGTLVVIRKVKNKVIIHTRSSENNAFVKLTKGLLENKEPLLELEGEYAIMLELVNKDKNLLEKLNEELRSLGVGELDEVPPLPGRPLAPEWVEYKLLGARVFESPALFSKGRLVGDERSALLPPDSARRYLSALKEALAAPVEEARRDEDVEVEANKAENFDDLMMIKKLALPIEGWVLWLKDDVSEELVGPVPYYFRPDPLLKLKLDWYLFFARCPKIRTALDCARWMKDDLGEELVTKIELVSRLLEEAKRNKINVKKYLEAPLSEIDRVIIELTSLLG
ncbi:T4 RnlA family RNA ligase [Ignicoccus hospitalis]|uniref:T4 RNA ligase 1-like N-terminal domain-containing protein n=1 Tax=Ignicoccus hospitalis (strain KIN4/I / DSM 18386 / JCM 14125) TaxID=453591 RepID=A8ABK4_IGNH4|nr:T4 RnlA family RNA ligase [Ignicoccus hospitalis]ABU82306.1 hypothetical protein Igni_1129 [Ignicoccus hospitalis KIN4/I]HIH90774.1 hypothetical protein [Desulfurococcaceae archaeon]